MTRNLKALGLVLLATFAMSAVAASAATANQDTIQVAGDANAILTTEAIEDQHFVIEEVPLLVCEEIVVENATVEGGDTTITVEPQYNKCTSPFGGVEVDINECHYNFTGLTDENGDSEVNIECPEGEAIELTGAFGCTISYGNQELSGVSFENKEGAVVLSPTVTGLEHTATPICALVGIAAAGEKGTYAGDVTVTGDEDDEGVPGEPIGISVETEE